MGKPARLERQTLLQTDKFVSSFMLLSAHKLAFSSRTCFWCLPCHMALTFRCLFPFAVGSSGCVSLQILHTSGPGSVFCLPAN